MNARRIREPQVVWRKSSRSGILDDSSCVEVGCGGGFVAIRDSKDPDGAVLLFEPGDWRAFVQLVPTLQ